MREIILEKLKELGELQNHENVEMQTRNMISEIWLLLMEEIKNRTAEDIQIPSVARERLFSMMQYIHANYSEKITLEDIANAAAISSRECLRCFNLCLRETPIEYLTNHRINMAKEMLKNTNKMIGCLMMLCLLMQNTGLADANPVFHVCTFLNCLIGIR